MRFPLIVLLGTLSYACAQDSGHCVEGTVFFPFTGTVYIMLTTQEMYSSETAGIARKKIAVDSSLAVAHAAAFRFDNIAPGTYGIRCFQDVNCNGTLDMGMFGPKEPWDMSWRKKRPVGFPKFEQISFYLHADTSGITLNLK